MRAEPLAKSTPLTQVGLTQISVNPPEADPRRSAILLRKEVIQPQIPLRLPCYDLLLIADSILPRLRRDSDGLNFPQLTGGVYKTRERIHGRIADRPLLATPLHAGELQPAI